MDQAAIDIMPDVKKYLEYIGKKIYIEKVMVQKPGGQVVEIGSVNLKVQ